MQFPGGMVISSHEWHGHLEFIPQNLLSLASLNVWSLYHVEVLWHDPVTCCEAKILADRMKTNQTYFFLPLSSRKKYRWAWPVRLLPSQVWLANVQGMLLKQQLDHLLHW